MPFIISRLPTSCASVETHRVTSDRALRFVVLKSGGEDRCVCSGHAYRSPDRVIMITDHLGSVRPCAGDV